MAETRSIEHMYTSFHGYRIARYRATTRACTTRCVRSFFWKVVHHEKTHTAT